MPHGRAVQFTSHRLWRVLLEWALDHGGLVAVNQASAALGLAYSTCWNVMKRHHAVFEKYGPGVYRLVTRETYSEPAVLGLDTDAAMRGLWPLAGGSGASGTARPQPESI